MRSTPRKKLDNLYDWIEANHRAHERRKQVKKQLKVMDKKEISSEEYSSYLNYWKKYGINTKRYWVDLYKKEGEPFDNRYLPDDVYYRDIIPYYSNSKFRRPYEDKCFHDRMFPTLSRPLTVAKCMAGIYYNKDNEIIDLTEVKRLIKDNGNTIFKPSIDSGAGRLIQFYNKDENSDADLDKIIKDAGSNFICQEVVKQHEKMASLNPKSLNTIRVFTFLFKGEAHVLSTICRMGAGSAKVDNVTAGGLQIAVSNEGKLTGTASDKYRHKHEFHPDTKVEFEGFEVPSFDKIVEICKREQLKLPHFKIVGWDFSIDITGEPIFIEYNVCPGLNQMTCGPTFGDLTEEVMEDVFIKKSLSGSMN